MYLQFIESSEFDFACKSVRNISHYIHMYVAAIIVVLGYVDEPLKRAFMFARDAVTDSISAPTTSMQEKSQNPQTLFEQCPMILFC